MREIDLVNWLECDKESKNFGDLQLIMELGRRGISTNHWPSSLHIRWSLNRQDFNIISKLSKYYRKITFKFENMDLIGACPFAKSALINLIICHVELTLENAELIAISLGQFNCSQFILHDHGSSEVILKKMEPT